MKSDRELVSWFQKYVQGFFELGTDLRNGLALISFVETVGGVTLPHSKDPKTIEECHRNCTIALMAIFRLYENLDVDIVADDIIEGKVERIRVLLDALSSDEWVIELPDQQTPWVDTFDMTKCDLEAYDIPSVLLIQSSFRRYRDSHILHQLAKNNKHRLKILAELKETEELYVKNLEIIVKTYYEPMLWKANLAEKSKVEPMVTAQEIGEIFSNVTAIFECNKNLLGEIEERMESVSCHTCIGDIFIKFAPYFRIYTQYYNNFEDSTSLLDKLRKERPLLNDFFRSCLAIPECRGQPFDSLLITPVQRLPRYILLLKELQGNTNKEHPDNENLQEAILQVQKQANTLNKKIQSSQAAREVVLIQNKLVGDNIPNIVSPSRYYITEGTFMETNLDRKHGKDFEKLHVFVFNDILLTTKKIMRDVFRYRNVIKLAAPTRIKDIMDLGVIKNAFNIISPRKTLTLTCHDESQKTEWMMILSQQIAQNLETTRSRTIMMPDSSPVIPKTTLICKTASITGTKKEQDASGKSFTVYCILVTTFERDTNYTVYRRYREFDALAKNLKRKYPEEDFIQLPKKHMVNNLSAETVESRQVVLETFLEDILSKPKVQYSDEIVVFLAPSDNYIPTNKKRITKLKQPEHLKKQEEVRKKMLKTKPKKIKKQPHRTSTLEDIFSKMGPAGSFEDLLPIQPTSKSVSPIVEAELNASPLIHSSPSVFLPPESKKEPEEHMAHSAGDITYSDPIPGSPVRIVRKRGGRGRGHGRGMTAGLRTVPKPASPCVIPLRGPPLTDNAKRRDFMNTLSITMDRAPTITGNSFYSPQHATMRRKLPEIKSSILSPLASKSQDSQVPVTPKPLPPIPPRISRSVDRTTDEKKRKSKSLERSQ